MTLLEEYILFEVQDTGVGISEENQKKLFKLFGFIEDTSGKNTNGIGIGLMITEQLVTQYKGKIWVESKPDVGSSFFFKLKIIQDDREEQIIQQSQDNEQIRASQIEHI